MIENELANSIAKIKRNISLIGMPGCFKSTVGKLLAKKLGWQFLDVDDLYEIEYGESIADTFANSGEIEFRKRETAVLEKAVLVSNAVIATGGGAVLDRKNRNILKESTTVIYLSAHVYTLFNRVKNSKNRPLLSEMTVQKIQELFNSRKELYENLYDLKITTDYKHPKQIVTEIICKVCNPQ